MFDQIRVDNGREFYLMLGMQELRKELKKKSKHILLLTNTIPKGICFVRFFFVCLLVCFVLVILWLNSLF